MPTSCVVPKCKTGNKSEKIKRSVFRVPKDKEHLKKWEAAIPGNTELRPTHVVCDKHFKDRYILRDWIKYGSDGEIAKAPYKYPQLSKLAIPTEFDDGDKENECKQSAGSPFLGHGVLVPQIAGPRVIHSESVDLGNRTMQMDVAGSNPINIVDSPAVRHVPSMEELLGATNIANNGSPVADVEVSLRMEGKDGDAAFRIDSEPFLVSSTVTISGWMQDDSTVPLQKYLVAVPSSWSVSEKRTEEGQAILFSYAVMKKGNNGSIPVTQRCVVFNANRTLQYFVYGYRVQTQGTQLNATLNDVTSLLSTLEAFQRMGICNGLGIREISVPIENAYQDCVQPWRHRNCTLISKRKRCDRCVRLRNRVKQQMKSMESRPILKRIHRKTSNPLDQRKILALLKKNARERRKKLAAQRKVQNTCARYGKSWT